jgi:sec-independent protein translocase protein TatC
VSAPLTEHLAEIRRRLVVSLVAMAAASVAGYAIYPEVSALLIRPFNDLAALAPDGRLLVVGTIFEGFATRIRIALLTGLVLSSPVHVYGILAFVFPGLTRREKRLVGATLASGLVLAGAAFSYGYFVAVPLAIRFLSGRGFIPPPVGLLLSYGRTVMFVLQFLLATILVFQFPLVLTLAMGLGVVRRVQLVRANRFIVVGIFVVAAVVTPPDVVSQLCVAIPLVALYFGALLVARVFRLGES